MPLAFKTIDVKVPEGTGRRTIRESFTFETRVKAVTAAINRFRFRLVDPHQQHVEVVEADADVFAPRGKTVPFAVECDYGDVDGTTAYEGRITVLLIADVEPSQDAPDSSGFLFF